MADQLLIRFQGVEGIADTPWLTLSPGVSIMTGRNNVGKSRLFEAAGRLFRALDDALNNRGVPQVRVVMDGRIVELDPRIAEGLPMNYGPAPRSYTIRWKDQPGKPGYRMEWAVDDNRQLRLRSFEGDQPTDTIVGAPQAFRGLQILPLHREFSLNVSRLIYVPPERPTQAEQGTNPVDLPAPNATDLARAIYSHLNRVTPQAAALQKIVTEIFPEVEMILTPPAGENRFTLKLRDRFAHKDISLDNAGTGVARILHLITSVLFHPPGRIFLIDEPTTHLHPGSAKGACGVLSRTLGT